MQFLGCSQVNSKTGLKKKKSEKDISHLQRHDEVRTSCRLGFVFELVCAIVCRPCIYICGLKPNVTLSSSLSSLVGIEWFFSHLSPH